MAQTLVAMRGGEPGVAGVPPPPCAGLCLAWTPSAQLFARDAAAYEAAVVLFFVPPVRDALGPSSALLVYITVLFAFTPRHLGPALDVLAKNMAGVGVGIALGLIGVEAEQVSNDENAWLLVMLVLFLTAFAAAWVALTDISLFGSGILCLVMTFTMCIAVWLGTDNPDGTHDIAAMRPLGQEIAASLIKTCAAASAISLLSTMLPFPSLGLWSLRGAIVSTLDASCRVLAMSATRLFGPQTIDSDNMERTLPEWDFTDADLQALAETRLEAVERTDAVEPLAVAASLELRWLFSGAGLRHRQLAASVANAASGITTLSFGAAYDWFFPRTSEWFTGWGHGGRGGHDSEVLDALQSGSSTKSSVRLRNMTAVLDRESFATLRVEETSGRASRRKLEDEALVADAELRHSLRRLVWKVIDDLFALVRALEDGLTSLKYSEDARSLLMTLSHSAAALEAATQDAVLVPARSTWQVSNVAHTTVTFLFALSRLGTLMAPVVDEAGELHPLYRRNRPHESYLADWFLTPKRAAGRQKQPIGVEFSAGAESVPSGALGTFARSWQAIAVALASQEGKGSFKTALAVCIVSSFGFMKWSRKAFNVVGGISAVGVTTILMLYQFPGDIFVKGFQRLLAACVAIGFGNAAWYSTLPLIGNNPTLRAFALLAWHQPLIIASTYAKYYLPRVQYAGIMSYFVFSIVLDGYVVGSGESGEPVRGQGFWLFALWALANNAIGVLVATSVNLLLFPTFASVALRRKLARASRDLYTVATAMALRRLQSGRTPEVLAKDKRIVSSILSTLRGTSAELRKCDQLLPLAELDPPLSETNPSLKFDRDGYAELIHSLRIVRRGLFALAENAAFSIPRSEADLKMNERLALGLRHSRKQFSMMQLSLYTIIEASLSRSRPTPSFRPELRDLMNLMDDMTGVRASAQDAWAAEAGDPDGSRLTGAFVMAFYAYANGHKLVVHHLCQAAALCDRLFGRETLYPHVA